MSVSPADTSAPTAPSWRAWLAYALGMLFFFYAFVHRVSPSVMTDALMRDFGVGAAAVGLLSSLYFLPYAMMQLPVGLLVDQYGARRLMSAALALCATATLAFGAAEAFWIAGIARAVIGVSAAFAFVGTLSIASRVLSPERFALLSGLLLAVGMLGAVAGQAPLRALFDTLGWRPAFVILAGAGFLLAAAIWFLVPRRQGMPSGGEARAALASSLRAVLASRDTWLCAVAGFGFSATMLGFAALWAVPWLVDVRGLSHTVAAGIASAMFLGWAVGSPLNGGIADRIGRRRPVALAGGLLTVATLVPLLYLPLSSPGLLALLCFTNGIGASSMVVFFSLAREHNTAEHGSSAMGLVNMCVVGAGAIMQPLIGLLLDLRWTGDTEDGVRIYGAEAYAFALGVLVIVAVVGLLAAIAIRETGGRRAGETQA